MVNDTLMLICSDINSHVIEPFNQSVSLDEMFNGIKEIFTYLHNIIDTTVNDSTLTNITDDYYDKLLAPIDEKSKSQFQVYLVQYWDRILRDGLGLAQIDDCIMLLVLIRLIILIIRYNIVTAFAITAIGVVAAYLWYSTLLGTLFMFEQLLYQNTYTFRLAKDSYELRTILQAKVRDASYQTRITNPIGILGYALGNGIIYDGHFIDPISMIMTKLPTILKHTPIIRRFDIDVVGPYYYVIKKVIPSGIRIGMRIVNQITSMGSYAFFTRVNKRYCPYLVRWHWTTLITFQFMAGYYIYFIVRILDYKEGTVYPQIVQAKKYNIPISEKELEMEFITNVVFILLIGQILAIIIAMLHALCGQYFFLPFLTKNIELHIGKRDPSLLWSGGGTAWQEKKEQKSWWFLPKIWYGWFGRGTTKPNAFFVFLRWAIYNPIYRVVRKLIRFFKKR